MFLFNGAPLGTEEKIAKVAVKPRKPQGYESLFAKYQREKEIMEKHNKGLNATISKYDNNHNYTTSNTSSINNHVNNNNNNNQFINTNNNFYKKDDEYNNNVSFKIYNEDEDDFDYDKYRPDANNKYNIGRYDDDEAPQKIMEHDQQEEDNEGEDSEEESALISPPKKRVVVKSLFDELDFLDDFENFSEFNNHMILSKDVLKKKGSTSNNNDNHNNNFKSAAIMKKTAPSISKRQTKVAQKTSQQRRPDTGESKNFVESKCFKGAKKGYIFKMDKNGVGYYKDTYYKRPLSQPKRYRQQPQQQQQKQLSSKQNKKSFRRNKNNIVTGPQQPNKKKTINHNSHNVRRSTGSLYNGIESMLHSKGPFIDNTRNNNNNNNVASTSLPPAMTQGVKLPKVASLPKLRSELSQMRKISSGIVQNKGSHPAYAKRPSQREMDMNPDRPFDYAKLREAMEYAKQFDFKVNSEKLMQGAPTANNKSNNGGGNNNNNNNSNNKTKSKNNIRRKKGTSREHKILRDVYQNRSRMMASGGKSTGSGKNRRRGSKQRKHGNKIEAPKSNMESLVENFEKGLELQRLRAELEESKQSYYASNKFIEQSQSWFNA